MKNVFLHKGRSSDVCKNFEDEYFDFIYIDADHSFDAVLNDLKNWYPKVKKGGVISGHDWDCNPLLSEFHLFGVERAVREFLNNKISKVTLTDEQYHKSWFWIKS